jgi:sterol desaturase/sphingolipid hydroxylase (fatty acid hydroxylase superfamily)
MPLLPYTRECLDAAEGRWPATGAWVQHGGKQAPAAPVAPRGLKRPVALRIFDHRALELVARAHPLTPIVWTAPIIVLGVARTARTLGPWHAVGIVLAGWLLWTLIEYLLHRFLFHMSASDEPGRLRSFLLHGYHHEFPGDRSRLVAPVMMAWPLAAMVFAVFVLVFGWTLAVGLFAGTMAGYVAYDWTHYYTHHFKPRNPVGRWLQRYHLMHHFDDPAAEHRFGVSSPLWDLVFGTYRSPATRLRGSASSAHGSEAASAP